MHTLPRIATIFLSFIFSFVMLVNTVENPIHTDKEIPLTEPSIENRIRTDKGALPDETEPSVAKPITLEMVHSSEPVKEEWPYPITQEEIDLIALVVMAEAEGETELGKRLVVDTILNRMDDPHFPDSVHDVIYYPKAFSCIWNGRIDRCYVMSDIVELVKEELLDRTNYECVFFMAGEYSKYGEPMFQECCHYFSSYD